MRQYADILAFDRYGQLALIAEVKIKRGASNEWAARMRRNMFAHGLLPSAPFFLLALPDNFYLWKNTDRHLDIIEPTQKVDPQPFLQPYYKSFGISLDNLTGRSFELIVTSWLSQILRAKSPKDFFGENQDWLVSSGLFDKLVGGNLEIEVAV